MYITHILKNPTTKAFFFCKRNFSLRPYQL